VGWRRIEMGRRRNGGGKKRGRSKRGGREYYLAFTAHSKIAYILSKSTNGVVL
jgi:hypothetical protein